MTLSDLEQLAHAVLLGVEGVAIWLGMVMAVGAAGLALDKFA